MAKDGIAYAEAAPPGAPTATVHWRVASTIIGVTSVKQLDETRRM